MLPDHDEPLQLRAKELRNRAVPSTSEVDVLAKTARSRRREYDSPEVFGASALQLPGLKIPSSSLPKEASNLSAITASTPYDRVVDGGRSLQANRLNQSSSQDSFEGFPEDDYSDVVLQSEGVRMIEMIRNRLYEVSTRIPSATDTSKWFITKKRLKEIMRLEDVSSALKSLDLKSQTEHVHLAREICAVASSHESDDRKTYRAIFALLIMTGQQAYIAEFVNRGLDDSRLPFERHGWADSGVGTKEGDEIIDSHPLKEFSWSISDKESFLRTQWELIPAFFGKKPGKKVPHYTLRPEQVLPYRHSEAADVVADEEKGHMEGAFGFVTVYDLHEDQQDLDRHTVSD